MQTTMYLCHFRQTSCLYVYGGISLFEEKNFIFCFGRGLNNNEDNEITEEKLNKKIRLEKDNKNSKDKSILITF
jgi:hypothetical protein